jgi:hypothetical protein
MIELIGAMWHGMTDCCNNWARKGAMGLAMIDFWSNWCGNDGLVAVIRARNDELIGVMGMEAIGVMGPMLGSKVVEWAAVMGWLHY